MRGIEQQSIRAVRELVHRFRDGEDVRVWFFGSRANGNADSTSDIDLGYLPGPGLVRKRIVLLQEALEELNIPYSVDLVDLSTASEALRMNALKEGIPWIS